MNYIAHLELEDVMKDRVPFADTVTFLHFINHFKSLFFSWEDLRHLSKQIIL